MKTNVQLFKCFNAILKVSLTQNLHKIYIKFLLELRNVIDVSTAIASGRPELSPAMKHSRMFKRILEPPAQFLLSCTIQECHQSPELSRSTGEQ